MNKLATALVAFQAECPSVPYDSVNPHFKSRFASLAAIHRVIQPILAKHGLAVVQMPISEDGRAGVETTIIHASGEALAQRFTLPTAKNDPQGAGAAITYARRYGLAGALGIVADEDDDGEAAQGRTAAILKPMRQPEPRASAKKSPAMSAANREKLKFAARERLKELTGDSGTADEVMGVLKDVAKGLGHGSPVEMTDAEFGPALEAVQKWEPGA